MLSDIEKGVAKGQRNDAAARITGGLFNKYGVDSERLVWRTLKDWNTNNKPPLEEEELGEVFGSIKRREQSSLRSKQEILKGADSSNPSKKSHSELAREFLETELARGIHWQYVPELEFFYRYKEEQGVWMKVKDQYLKSRVRKLALSVSNKLDKDYSIKEITSAMKDSLSSSDNKKKLDPAENPNEELINVKNGMVNWKKETLEDHSPDHYSTLQLPIDYDREAGWDNWEETMVEWIPQKSTRKFLQEFIGYSLIPDTSQQKSVILHGSGSNGKSTFLEVIGALFGERNLTHIPLHRLANRFETGKLKGKLVNICPDIDSNYIKNTGLLKTLIAGEILRGEEKHKPSYDFRPIARLMFSANELPNSSDKTEAWYRRFDFIEFPRSFKPGNNSYNPKLKEELLDELPGILNWAINGLRRLEDRGHFISSESMEKSKARYRSINDSVKYFYEENVMDTSGVEFLPTRYLYRKFKDFCDDTGMNIVSMQKFSKRLKELGLSKDRRRTEICEEHGRYKCPECAEFSRTKESQVRGFRGVGLSM